MHAIKICSSSSIEKENSQITVLCLQKCLLSGKPILLLAASYMNHCWCHTTKHNFEQGILILFSCLLERQVKLSVFSLAVPKSFSCYAIYATYFPRIPLI